MSKRPLPREDGPAHSSPLLAVLKRSLKRCSKNWVVDSSVLSVQERLALIPSIEKKACMPVTPAPEM